MVADRTFQIRVKKHHRLQRYNAASEHNTPVIQTSLDRHSKSTTHTRPLPTHVTVIFNLLDPHIIVTPVCQSKICHYQGFQPRVPEPPKLGNPDICQPPKLGSGLTCLKPELSWLKKTVR